MKDIFLPTFNENILFIKKENISKKKKTFMIIFPLWHKKHSKI